MLWFIYNFIPDGPSQAGKSGGQFRHMQFFLEFNEYLTTLHVQYSSSIVDLEMVAQNTESQGPLGMRINWYKAR